MPTVLDGVDADPLPAGRRGDVQVINNLPTALTGATAHISIYNLDGSIPYQHDFAVTAPPSVATSSDTRAPPVRSTASRMSC